MQLGVNGIQSSDRPEDALMNHSEKQRLDGLLMSWVIGKLDDSDLLTRLFPLAVHYRSAVNAEAFPQALQKDFKIASFDVASLVLQTWLTLIDHIGGRDAAAFMDAFDGVTCELDLGMSREDFRDRIKRGSRGESMPPFG